MTRTVSLLLPYLSCKTAVRSLTSHLPGVEIERIVLHCAWSSSGGGNVTDNGGHDGDDSAGDFGSGDDDGFTTIGMMMVWCWWQCNGVKFAISHTSSFRVLQSLPYIQRIAEISSSCNWILLFVMMSLITDSGTSECLIPMA